MIRFKYFRKKNKNKNLINQSKVTKKKLKTTVSSMFPMLLKKNLLPINLSKKINQYNGLR